MGFHTCPYCTENQKNDYEITSSGDIYLFFISGRSYVVPDMILHYIHDHGWVPPKQFIEDVINDKLDIGRKNVVMHDAKTVEVGYLKNSFKPGSVPEGFVEKLELLMAMAAQNGSRIQTKSLIMI